MKTHNLFLEKGNKNTGTRSASVQLRGWPALPSGLHPFVHVTGFVELGSQTLIWLSLLHLSALSLKVCGFLTLLSCVTSLLSGDHSLSPDCRNDRHPGLEEQLRISTTDSDARTAKLVRGRVP